MYWQIVTHILVPNLHMYYRCTNFMTFENISNLLFMLTHFVNPNATMSIYN